MDQRSVLVVEDDPAVRALIADLLDEAGYAVFQADCGRRALRLAQDHVPSVVVMDHVLPDMSGLDLLEELRTRATSKYIPVMLVSGLAHQLDGRDHDADGILAKPFDIDALVEKVDALAAFTKDGIA
jgi:two-component system phosphate regulon response regulator PhoB